jgi:hypothetical protein
MAGSILKCSPLLFTGMARGGLLILVLIPLRIRRLTEKTKGLLMGVFAEFFGQIGFLSDIYRIYIGH